MEEKWKLAGELIVYQISLFLNGVILCVVFQRVLDHNLPQIIF